MRIILHLWIIAAGASQIYNPPIKRNVYTYESSTDWPGLALAIIQWTLPAVIALIYYRPLSSWIHQRRRVLAIVTATAAILTVAAFAPDMWKQSRGQSHAMTADEFLDATDPTPQPAAQPLAQRNPAPALISAQDRILIRTFPATANQVRKAQKATP